MRLFVGLAIDTLATEALLRFRETLHGPPNGFRWTKPETWHVTLQFLGNVTPGEYECLAEHLAGIHLAPAAFAIAGTGVFERAGIFYANVERAPSLLALHARVVQATAKCGFREEAGGYHPHVTLARRSRFGRGGRLGSLPEHALAAVPQLAREFVLYESRLGPTGPQYLARARFPLVAG